MLLNKDGIKSHNPLEKYFSMQRVKGGADKNPTEKFNWYFWGLNAPGDKLVPLVDGNNQVHWKEMAQLDVPWDQITLKRREK